MLVLGPGQPLDLFIGVGTEMMILQLFSWEAGPASQTAVHPHGGVLAEAVETFLRDTEFLVTYHQTRDAASELLSLLRRVLVHPGANVTLPRGKETNVRIRRAVEILQDQAAAQRFDLKEIATSAGVSQRNLYYQMRRQLGLTPGALLERMKLVPVLTA